MEQFKNCRERPTPEKDVFEVVCQYEDNRITVEGKGLEQSLKLLFDQGKFYKTNPEDESFTVSVGKQYILFSASQKTLKNKLLLSTEAGILKVLNLSLNLDKIQLCN